jgi:hypothetical protein
VSEKFWIITFSAVIEADNGIGINNTLHLVLLVLLFYLCASVFQNPVYEFRYQPWNRNDAM